MSPIARTHTPNRRLVAVALAGLLAVALGSTARADVDLRSPDTRDAAREAAATQVDLRSPDARDAAIEPAATQVDLRSPDRRDAAPVAAPPSDGVSREYLVIGGLGVLLVGALAATSLRRRRPARPPAGAQAGTSA